jgi:hypothetical protein
MDSTKDQKFGPNKAVPPPIDLTNRFYEISANSTYRVEPFVDLSAVPLLSSVPGIGSTATLSAKIKRCAEFPQGLVRGPGAQNSSSAAMQPSLPPSFASPALAAGTTIDPWNRPKIYEEIEAAGRKVVGHTVVQVDASNPFWTDTGLTVNPDQIVYIDFRADGFWFGNNFGSDPRDADGSWVLVNGLQRNGVNVEDIFGNYHQRPALSYCLVGKIQPTTPLIMAKPYDFNAGKQLYKYSPTKSGPLHLGFWNPNSVAADRYFPPSDIQSGRYSVTQKRAEELVEGYYKGNHKGVMTVRIIVTQ